MRQRIHAYICILAYAYAFRADPACAHITYMHICGACVECVYMHTDEIHIDFLSSPLRCVSPDRSNPLKHALWCRAAGGGAEGYAGGGGEARDLRR